MTMEIRSYHAVFDLERRIYRIDRLRLNPSGVPVRGVVYLLALIASVLVLAHTPPLELLAKALPWYLTYLALPCGGAALLTILRIDGRPVHLACQALARHWLGPRQLVGFGAGENRPHETATACWRPPQILLLPDGSEARMRRLRYSGPGAVLVAVAYERCGPTRHGRERRSLRLREAPNRPAPNGGQVIALAAGAKVRIG